MRARTARVALLVVAPEMAPRRAPPPQPAPTLVVRVLEDATGHPLANAEVLDLTSGQATSPRPPAADFARPPAAR